MTTSAPLRALRSRTLAWLLPVLLGAAGARAQTLVKSIPLAGRPQAAAVNPLTGRVYVVDSVSDLLVQLDARDPGSWQGSSGATGSNPTAVAFNPADNRVYVACAGEVWIYDADNVATPPAKVTVGGSPIALVADPGLNRVFVANQSSGTVSVLDCGNLPPAGTPALAVAVGTGSGSTPSALALDPIRHRVYVAGSGDQSVTVVDGAFPFATATTAAAAVPTAVVGGLGTPMMVAVDPVLNRAYVTDRYGQQVFMLDGAGLPWPGATPAQIIAPTPIAVGLQPWGVLASPFSHRVYVTNFQDDTVSVIEGTTVAKTVLVGVGPIGLAQDPLSGQVYVTSQTSGNVSVIDDTNLPAAGATAPALATDAGANAVAVDPLAGLAVVLNVTGGTVSVVDGWRYAPTPVALAAGAQPSALELDPVTGRVFAVNAGAGTVSVLGGAAGTTVLATPMAGAGAGATAADPALGRVYVANAAAGTVSVLSMDQPATPLATVTVGGNPVALAADPVSHRVFVANQADRTLTLFDGGDPAAATRTVALPSAPAAVAVDPARGKAFVTLPGSNQVAVLDVGDPAAAPVLAAVGQQPGALAVDTLAGRAYVANRGDGTVSVLDAAHPGTVLGSYVVGSQPAAVAVDPAGSRIYVANGGGTTVSVLDGRGLPIGGGQVGSLLDQDVAGAPRSLAVDPLTGKVFVRVAGVGAGAPDHLRVLESSAAAGLPDVLLGQGAGAVVVDPATGRVASTDPASDRVTVVDLPGTRPQVPITLGVTWNADVLALAGQRLRVTRNPSPSLTVTVTDTLAAGLTGTEATPGHLHYWVDDETGRTWDALLPDGAGPGTYTVTTQRLEPGLHSLYLVSGYGAEAGTISAGIGTGSSPVTSRVLVVPFLVRPLESAVTLDSSAPSQASGQPVTLTATVAKAATMAGVTAINPPSGTVRFYDGASFLAAGTLAASSGEGAASQATVSVTAILAPGAHTLTAVYAGDSAYDAASGSLSQAIYQGAASVQAAAGDGQAPGTVGTAFPVALQARVLDGNGLPVPGVTVTFAGAGLAFSAPGLGAGGALATDASGTATVTATPTAAGTLAATATVAGLAPATFHLAATGTSSAPPPDTPGTRTGLALAGTPAFGQPVTLTATVTDAAGGQPFAPATPAVAVVFLRDGVELGRAEPGPDGRAVFTTRRLAPGAGTLTARYPGDPGHGASDSAPLAVQVQPGLLVTLEAGPDLALAAGTSAAVAVTVEGQGAGGAPLALRIDGLPRGAVCAFSGFPATVPGAPVTGTATLTTTGPTPPPVWPTAGLGGGGLLAVGGLLAGRGRRRTLGLLGCLLGLALLGGLQGCVVRGRLDYTPAGAYDLTVTATAPGASPGSAPLRLTVR